ncbi:MAG: DsbA family protein [Terracidiphilus sp.]
MAVLAALAMALLPASRGLAQTEVPPAPAAHATQQRSAPMTIPTAPAPSTAPKFPKPEAKNFTADSPTKETVDSFLHASWGYDENRVWQVQAILKTATPGVSKVVIFVADRTGKQRPQAISFFTMPDGKHIVSGDQMIDFGADPYAAYRAMAQQRADGPYRGAASKDLELVEFADFECPVCKEAQANMDKLVADFPTARVVFQVYPLVMIHPQAMKAAEYGECVDKLGGSAAFFQYGAAVFQGQEGLSTPDGAILTLNSAVIKAGLQPTKVAACVAEPATAAAVDASTKLAQDLNIFQTPMLVVNGREIPPNIPYDTLKKVIEYQAKLDGITLPTPAPAPAAPPAAAPAKAPSGK